MKYLFFLSIFGLSLLFGYKCEDDLQTYDEIKSLLNKYPNDPSCIISLANRKIKKGEVLEGFELITKAYKIDKDFIESSKIRSILHPALKVTMLKESAIKNRDPLKWKEIGDLFFRIGIFTESAYAYKHSLNLNENQIDVKLSLAISYLKLNNNYLAVKEFMDSAKLDKNNYYIRYYLTRMMINEIFDCKKANHYYNEAKELAKQNNKKINNMQKILDQEIKTCMIK